MTTSITRPAGAGGDAGSIIDACEAEFPEARDDCSLFVRRVCARLGVDMAGNADAIVSAVRGGWRLLPDGAAAKAAADAGALVLAGLKGCEQVQPSVHGHVVIVVSGPLARRRYPTAYWGKLDGEGARARTINWAWQQIDRDQVTYGARLLPRSRPAAPGERLEALSPSEGEARGLHR